MIQHVKVATTKTQSAQKIQDQEQMRARHLYLQATVAEYGQWASKEFTSESLLAHRLNVVLFMKEIYVRLTKIPESVCGFV